MNGLPAAELASIADEYRRQHADARGRWESLDEIYGSDWWKAHPGEAAAMLREMSCSLSAAARWQMAADSAAADTLIHETRGASNG